jgi:hypothetical protein
MPLRFPSTLAAIGLLLYSCIDTNEYQIDGIDINPTMALPLVHGTVTIQDLLNDQDSAHVKVYPDGLVYLTYQNELKAQSIRELFEVEDQSLNRTFIIPAAAVPPHTAALRKDSIIQQVSFNLDPERLDEIALRSGRLNITTTILPQGSSLSYEVHAYFADFVSRTTGQSLTRVVRDNTTIDLSDYTFQLDDNRFDLKLVLVYRSSGTTTVIPPGSSVTVNLSFLDMEFNHIKGFLGDQSASLPEDELDISFFGETFGEAAISLAQPKVSLQVVNENGVPCVVNFVKLEARKEGAAPLSMIVSPGNPITVNYPAVLGQSATTSVTVTNVKDLLDYAPSSFVYQADARINQGLTAGNNFLLDSSALRVKVDVEIPLYGSASDIALKDTLEIDLSNDEASKISSAALKLKITNELPLNGTLQLYLTDDDFNIIETLLLPNQTNIIKGSSVTASGDLQAAGVYDNSIVMDQARLDNIFKATHVIIEATLETSRNGTGGAQDVKFKSSYGISIEAGVLVNLKLNIR